MYDLQNSTQGQGPSSRAVVLKKKALLRKYVLCEDTDPHRGKRKLEASSEAWLSRFPRTARAVTVPLEQKHASLTWCGAVGSNLLAAAGHHGKDLLELELLPALLKRARRVGVELALGDAHGDLHRERQLPR